MKTSMIPERNIKAHYIVWSIVSVLTGALMIYWRFGVLINTLFVVLIVQISFLHLKFSVGMTLLNIVSTLVATFFYCQQFFIAPLCRSNPYLIGLFAPFLFAGLWLIYGISLACAGVSKNKHK